MHLTLTLCRSKHNENDHKTHSKFTVFLVRLEIRMSCWEISYLLSLISVFVEKASEGTQKSFNNEQNLKAISCLNAPHEQSHQFQDTETMHSFNE